MQISRVDALLAKLEEHKADLDVVDFRVEIADFSVVELVRLSENLDRAIASRPLTVH